MKTYKIVYVILHYITVEDTIKCVESIFEKEKKSNFEIVIVDNNSPNNSGEILKKKYKTNKKIHLIINNENLGFSRGNNVGFKYAKEKLNADFIVLLNNDTSLLTENFSNLVFNDYKKYDFSVLGPKIYTKDSICGPLKMIPDTKESLSRELRNLKIKLLVRKIFNINLKKFWKKQIVQSIDYENIIEDVVLHGCFLIFSPNYIKKYDGLAEKTFFYGEETILYNRCKKNNMKLLFDPNIQIYHNEFSSTNSMIKSEKQREINRMTRLIKAYEIIVEEWDND